MLGVLVSCSIFGVLDVCVAGWYGGEFGVVMIGVVLASAIEEEPA